MSLYHQHGQQYKRILSIIELASAGDSTTSNSRMHNLFGRGQYSIVFGSNPRGDRWVHDRINWDEHVRQLLHEKKFAVEYRMSHKAWKKLRQILKPTLKRVHSMSRSSGPITVDMVMAAGIRRLSGGQVRDIRHIIGMSSTEAYNSIDKFIEAVNESPDLDIKMPSTAEEWESIRRGFSSRSSNNLMQGCVGALDGLLALISAPFKKEVTNVKAYYSGHYECYGLNCQAACDSRLLFLYFGVIAPGKTNDNTAYPLCHGLLHAIENLPLGMYFVGDAAYTATDRLLTPFTGSQRANPNNDAFNFHLSQMRIRIEMAFGRLVRKFGIMKSKMEGSLVKKSQIITACARLHNFIILNDLTVATDGDDEAIEDPEDAQVIPMSNAPMGMAYLPVIPDADDEWNSVPGISTVRSAIVEEIFRQGITRPISNRERNRNILNENNQHPRLIDNIEFFNPS